MNSSLNKALAAGVGLATLLILIRMVIWGGIPQGSPLFWVGVAVLLSTVGIFVALCGWLYFTPLPAGRVKLAPALPVRSYLMLMAGVVAALMAAVAIFWDETWHRIYGFGAVLTDFLWAPHKYLYLGLGLLALISGISLYQAIRADSRDVRAGFRAYPFVGIVGLATGYLIASLPADQIWHLVFGLDITAWSLPHIILVVSFSFALFALAAVFLASNKAKGAQPFGVNEVFGAVALGIAGVILLILVTEYDSVQSAVSPELFIQSAQVIGDRPQWTYPVALVVIGVLLATVGVRLSRRVGVVTLAALFIAVFRTVAVAFFNASGEMGIVSHLLVGLPMLVIDGWQLVRKGSIGSLWYQVAGALVAALACVAVSIPVINTYLVTYHVASEAIPGAFGVGLLMGLWASLLGNLIGGWLASLESGGLPEVALPRAVGQTAAMLLAAVVVFLLIFLTATPPIV